MGGRIWVDSEYKKGSTFSVELPRISHEEANRLIEAGTAYNQQYRHHPLMATDEPSVDDDANGKHLSALRRLQSFWVATKNKPATSGCASTSTQSLPTLVGGTTLACGAVGTHPRASASYHQRLTVFRQTYRNS